MKQTNFKLKSNILKNEKLLVLTANERKNERSGYANKAVDLKILKKAI